MAGNKKKSSFDMDTASFNRSLSAAFKKAELNSKAELLALGIKVKNEAVLYSPTDTGRLKTGWYIKQGDDARGPWVDVGNEVEYSTPVEFGHRIVAWGHETGNMQPAQPMLRPALLEQTIAWRPRNIT